MSRSCTSASLSRSRGGEAALRYEKWMKKTSPGALEAMRQWTEQMRAARAKKATA